MFPGGQASFIHIVSGVVTVSVNSQGGHRMTHAILLCENIMTFFSIAHSLEIYRNSIFIQLLSICDEDIYFLSRKCFRLYFHYVRRVYALDDGNFQEYGFQYLRQISLLGELGHNRVIQQRLLLIANVIKYKFI